LNHPELDSKAKKGDDVGKVIVVEFHRAANRLFVEPSLSHVADDSRGTATVPHIYRRLSAFRRSTPLTDAPRLRRSGSRWLY
jgi:hypothetical protein